MPVEITGSYLGNLKTELTHGPSGTTIRTAAPVDHEGDGSSFSPTDLVAAALGSCMLSILGILARRDGIELGNARFHVEKHMSSDPRRIGRLPIRLYLPASLTPEQRTKLERAAFTCPVHRSLAAEIEIPVEFVYE